MSDINTTPLIDVMLVLLIMFIITVPTQTHEIELDLPRQPPVPHVWIKPIRNELRMTGDGRLSWNEQAVSDGQLAALLRGVAGMAEQPEVHFRPDAAARYERVDQVLAIAAKSGASRFGFAGNEQYRDIF